jgi:hypothetical protein
MKKVILSLAILTIAALSANAQTAQGTWLLGGAAAFSSDSHSFPGEPTTTTSTFAIAPNIGYFFADNFAAGANIAFGSVSETGAPSSSTFAIGPFARYYFLPIGDNAKLFGDAGIEFGSTSPGGGAPSVSSTQWHIKAGPAFFLNEHTALEVTIGYGSSTSGSGSDKETDNAFQVGAGFQIHFGGGSSMKKK